MPRHGRRAPTLLVAAAATIAAPDTVFLKNGKKIEDVVVSRDDERGVRINPWNSRCPDMEWEIPEKNLIPREEVERVEVSDPPLVEFRRAASRPGLTAADHLDLAKRCEALGLKDEKRRHALLALGLAEAPDDEEALKLAGGRSAFDAWARGNPEGDARLREAERACVAAATPEELDAARRSLAELGSKRPFRYVERARRSARLGKGQREKVRLTLRSEAAPGATYCIHVPKSYDPLQPTGLVVALHGGGRGGVDPTIVTGSGEEAMPFYADVAERAGLIVVCPTALAPGWGASANEPLIDAVVDEMLALYNVDLNRVYLTGHSMGGFGAWQWGPKRPELWAAFAPCAGGGGPRTADLPVYIYHGADDDIVGPGSDRASAKALGGDKKKPDFVYTEMDGVGHGFPDWVRRDLFEFFLGRWKDRGRKRAVEPDSSFLRKPSKDEIKAFGDPDEAAAPEGGGDAKLSELIGRLEKGGGGGEAAVAELAPRKDAATVKAVARVLASKKASEDARVLAARALGAIGTAECVKPLAAHAGDESFRVVDAVTQALGSTRSRDAAEPLARAAKRMGELWHGSIRGGRIQFTEYEIRLESFGLLADALAIAGDPAVALPALGSEVVARVFTPATPYSIPTDERFDHIPPRARAALAKRLRAALVALGDARGVALLESIRRAWPGEAAIVRECEDGERDLSGG